MLHISMLLESEGGKIYLSISYYICVILRGRVSVLLFSSQVIPCYILRYSPCYSSPCRLYIALSVSY